jgi:hypothetical protein
MMMMRIVLEIMVCPNHELVKWRQEPQLPLTKYMKFTEYWKEHWTAFETVVGMLRCTPIICKWKRSKKTLTVQRG